MNRNVLVLMADQHAPSATGSYGNDVVQTPNLDRLAARGVRFENGYCNSPICVPARAAMATGRYVHRTGNWDNAAPYLGTEADSWGHRVTGVGARAITFGKLHYRSPDEPTGFPDQRLPLHVRGGRGDLTHILRADQPPLTVLRPSVAGARSGESEYTRYDRQITDEAVDWLTSEAVTMPAPWVCTVSLVTPHYPLVAPQKYLDLYDPESLPLPTRWNSSDWDRHPALARARHLRGFTEPLSEADTRAATRAYYGLVSFMDEQMGRVLDALESSGLAEDTLVLYVSDHGELAGTDGLWFKGTLQEPSVRIPMIAAGPGLPIGASCETPTSLVDVFPTVLHALGIAPYQADADLPGQSLLTTATQAYDPDREVFVEYHSASSITGSFMIRFDRWKYVYHCDLPPQLFDLTNDPSEANDLAPDPAYSHVLQAAHNRLVAICDPIHVDATVRADQRRRVEDAGGPEAVLAAAPQMAYSPAPATDGKND